MRDCCASTRGRLQSTSRKEQPSHDQAHTHNFSPPRDSAAVRQPIPDRGLRRHPHNGQRRRIHPASRGRTRCSQELEDRQRRVAAPEHQGGAERSEEHTSELQSLRHLVCRLLLEKKKKKTRTKLLTTWPISKTLAACRVSSC